MISCRTCVYWTPPERRSYGFAADVPPDMGQCRRMPPIAMMTEKGIRSQWPLTFADRHWCGEHATREAVEAARQEGGQP